MQRVRVLDAFALVHVVHDVTAGADEGKNVRDVRIRCQGRRPLIQELAQTSRLVTHKSILIDNFGPNNSPFNGNDFHPYFC